MKIEIDLKSVCIILVIVFVAMMCLITIRFIQALFKFPDMRAKLWHGITDGDNVPSLDDFRKTSQLFWAFVFGSGLVICLLLWAAFPENTTAWMYVTGSVAMVFLACIGLRSITGLFKH